MIVREVGACGRGRINAINAKLDGNAMLVPSYDALSLSNHFSVSGWFKVNEVFEFQSLFVRNNSATSFVDKWDAKGWGAQLYQDSKTLIIRGGSRTPRLQCTASDMKSWTFVVFIYEGATVQCFVNGTYVAKGEVVEPTDNASELGIGGWPNGLSDGHSMSGQYDEIRLRGGTLSADRIKADYDMIAKRDFCTYWEGGRRGWEVSWLFQSPDWHSPAGVAGAGLRQFDCLGIEEEVLEPHVDDAQVVHRGFAVAVGVDDDAPEAVMEMTEGVRFLREFFFRGNGERGLDIESLRAVIGDEIDFRRSGRLHAVFGRVGLDDADVNGITSSSELVENDILHQMGVLDLPEVERRISDPCVGGVEFRGNGKIAFALDVIADGAAKQKCVFKVREVLADCDVVDRCAAGGECVGQLGRIGQRSDVAHGEISQSFQQCAVLEPVTLGNVAKVNCGEDVLKIVPFFSFGCPQGAFWQPSVAEIEVSRLCKFDLSRKRGVELRKGEGEGLDDFASSSEIGRDFGRKQLGVRASHIDVGVGVVQKAVEDIVEGQVAVFSIFRGVAGEVNVWGKNFPGELYFVNQNEIFAVNCLCSRLDQFLKGKGIAKGVEIGLLKIDFNDVFGFDSRFEQMILEKAEQEKAFPASAYSRDYLHQMVAFRLNKAVEYRVAANNHHRYSPFNKVSMLLFLKADGIVAFPTLGGKGDESKLIFKEAA